MPSRTKRQLVKRLDCVYKKGLLPLQLHPVTPSRGGGDEAVPKW